MADFSTDLGQIAVPACRRAAARIAAIMAPRHLLRRDAFREVLRAIGIAHQRLPVRLPAAAGRYQTKFQRRLTGFDAVVGTGHRVADHLFASGQAEAEVRRTAWSRVQLRQAVFIVAHARARPRSRRSCGCTWWAPAAHAAVERMPSAATSRSACRVLAIGQAGR